MDSSTAVPMKSMTRRPSQYLPAGLPKYVSPFGGGACPNTADRPPVSELESPKLNNAGKSQLAPAWPEGMKKEVETVINSRNRRAESPIISSCRSWQFEDRQAGFVSSVKLIKERRGAGGNKKVMSCAGRSSFKT